MSLNPGRDPLFVAVPRRRRWRRSGVGMVLALCLTTLGCGQDEGSSSEFHATVVDPPFVVADAVLEADDGTTLRMPQEFSKNRLNIVFFGYTNCPDICPAIMGSLAVGLVQLDKEDRDQVGVYFITTDPARDTGPVLEGYLERLDPTFVGVTGDLSDIAALGKSVGIYVDEGERLPSGGYDPNSHGTYVMAVGQDGQAPAFWDRDTSPSQFAADIDRLLD